MEVGIAVKKYLEESGQKRTDIFITSKILTPRGSVEESYAQCINSIEALDENRDFNDLAFVDLFLIHSPSTGPEARKEMWLALEMLVKLRRVRYIGVSNWGIGHIEELKTYATIWPPHVLQIEVCIHFLHGISDGDLTKSVTSILSATSCS
ncbi:hypothetical protein NHQ30_005766 [Ciborinia camelliae]|nr:hypothetical protein NHQ30_005766 [Ciborinia camelliae]